jgi:hypothetical protein
MRCATILLFTLMCACKGDPTASTSKPQEAPAPLADPPASSETLPSSDAHEPTAERVSQFTTLNEKSCKTVQEDKETGDWSGACPGVGPYALNWSIGDLRDDLEVIRGGQRTQLGIPSIVAKGAFDSIGQTLEWRGPAAGPPDVLVARVSVARPDGTSDSGRLTIIWLGEKPCIVAVIPPQAGQSDKARAIADGKLPACVAD